MGTEPERSSLPSSVGLPFPILQGHFLSFSYLSPLAYNTDFCSPDFFPNLHYLGEQHFIAWAVYKVLCSLRKAEALGLATCLSSAAAGDGEVPSGEG